MDGSISLTVAALPADAPPSVDKAGLPISVGALLPLAILSLWELASHLRWVKPVFLPTPEKTVVAFFTMLTQQDFLLDFLASIEIVLQGFIYGAGLGILLGAAAGLSRAIQRILGPTLDGVRQIPAIAWLPLIVLWLGIGPLAKVVIITKVVFFPVFLNTLQGIRGVPKDYIDLSRVLTLRRWQFIRRIIIPAATPSILVGVRYGAGLAWAMVVVAEGLSGMQGIGYLIFRAQALLLTDQLLVCMVIIGVVGFTIDRGVLLLERHLLRWKQGFEGN
ncbi:ABC transporter permease [Acidisphaera sp. S103]|uniref:ABC transporter permease n=1 Tax=Acidisphaera sp. S103 TaxID=1747223 RepID=UPI00131A95E1|nr:ABC transporter permease [Acidisphaera sp. S103]